MRNSYGPIYHEKPSILVLYPPGHRYYATHEIFGMLPRFNCQYVVEYPGFGQATRQSLDIRTLKYTGLPAFSLGVAEVGRTVRGLKELINQCSPDVVITYETHSRISYEIGRLRRRHGFLHVVHCDQTIAMKTSLWGIFPLTHFFARTVSQSADLFLARSKRAANVLENLGVDARRITVLPHGLFVADFDVRNSDSPSRSPGLVFVGSLGANKGIPTLLHALNHLQDYYPASIVLRVAGTGPLDNLVREASHHDKRIQYLGWIDELRKIRLLQTSDIFVYPSEDQKSFSLKRWEEQGAISVLEAMAAGLPIVGSDSGVLPELIGDGGRIFHQGDPRALAAAIAELLKDSTLREAMGVSNRRRVEEGYDIAKLAKRLELRLLDAISMRGNSVS